MSNKDFDKKLKNNLGNYPSPLNVDVFWASIEDEVVEINSNQKLKRQLPFFFFGGLVLVFVGVLLFFNVDDQKLTELHQDEKLNNEEFFNNENDKTIVSSIQEKKFEEGKVNLKEENFEKNIKLDSGKINTKSNFSNFQKVEKTKFVAKENNAILVFEKNKTNDQQYLERQNEELFFDKKSKKQEQSNFEKLEIIPLKSRILFLEKNEIDFIPKHSFQKEKTWKLFFGIQGGANYSSRQLENQLPEFEEYAKLRSETETSEIGFQFGLTTGMKHKSGFTFSSGINFTQIVEQFKFRGSTFQSVLVEDGVIQYQVNINNDTVPVFGDLIYVQETVHNKEYQNHYRFFEIPILLGYQKDFEKWSIGIQGGVSANISLKTSGLIFSPTNDFVFLEDSQEEYFNSNLGLSYYFGGVVSYFLNDNIGLTFSPHFRSFPKSITKSEKGISQKFNLVGLNMGMEFHF